MKHKDNQNPTVRIVKTLAALLMAGAAFTACTSEEQSASTADPVETVANEQPVQSASPAYRISIPASFGEGSETRAVVFNSETGALDAEFTTGDIIIVTIISEGDNQTATTILKPDKAGGSANLVPYSGSTVSFTKYSGTMTTEPPTPVTLTGNETLFLEYHGSGINEFFDYTGLYTDPVGTPQVGTLANLSLFDYATATVQVTGITGNETDGYTLTTTEAAFENQQSMYKFTFTGLPSGVGVKTVTIHSDKDRLVAAYSPTLVVLGTAVTAPVDPIAYGDITIDLGDAASSSNSTVYAALRFDPLDSETETDDITFTVTGTDDNTYTVTKTTRAGGFQNGKYYASTIALDTYRVYTAKDTYTVEPIPENATTVTSTTYPWSAGTYVVKGNVTISHSVGLAGDVKLILKDGASLTIDGYICGSNNTNYSLEIYGQAAGTGKLTVDNGTSVSNNSNGMTVKNLTVHGGETEVNTNRTSTMDGIYSSGPITVYNGKVTASSSNGCGIKIKYSDLFVYGGEVNATADKDDAILFDNSDESTGSNLTISGGSVTAESKYKGAGIHFKGGIDQITVSGGKLTIIGGESSSSYYAYGLYFDPYSAGTFTISGGTVDISGGKASSSRQGGDGILFYGTFNVTGGSLTVHGGEGSDTKDGGHGIYFKRGGNLTVNGGTVNITGGKSANGVNGSSIHEFTGGQSSIAGGEGKRAFNQDVKIKSGMAAYCSDSPSPSGTTIQGNDQQVTLSYRYVDIR